jgi:hypothetical protein
MCPSCYEKQLKIDALQDEVKYLKDKLRYEERKTKEGYFGSSTPSSKKPFKEEAGDKIKKNGGARPGTKGMVEEKYPRNKLTKSRKSASAVNARIARGC